MRRSAAPKQAGVAGAPRCAEQFMPPANVRASVQDPCRGPAPQIWRVATPVHMHTYKSGHVRDQTCQDRPPCFKPVFQARVSALHFNIECDFHFAAGRNFHAELEGMGVLLCERMARLENLPLPPLMLDGGNRAGAVFVVAQVDFI